MEAFPPLFLERLRKIIPEEDFPAVLENFSKEKILCARVNTLKNSGKEVAAVLREHNILFREVPWYREALFIPREAKEDLEKTGLACEGKIFPQSLSSLLPVLVLDPQPGENVLDMCAAPGGKTAQMAAHMNNSGTIIALERVKDRYYRLKSVLSLLGVEITESKLMDARRFRADGILFDKILVDAPCSTEGRFRAGDKKSFAYWSPRKIKEMSHKQKGLLLVASRLLKDKGSLVYSTCTFSPEENEEVIDWLLRKTGGAMRVVPVKFEGVKTYPTASSWGKKTFSDEIVSCVKVLPTDTMEGFFIAKLAKRKRG